MSCARRWKILNRAAAQENTANVHDFMGFDYLLALSLTWTAVAVLTPLAFIYHLWLYDSHEYDTNESMKSSSVAHRADPSMIYHNFFALSIRQLSIAFFLLFFCFHIPRHNSLHGTQIH